MQELLTRVLARLTGVENPPVTVPEVADFGHFSTPVALQMAKAQKKNPMGLASELAMALFSDPELQGIVLNAEAVSPGFVNIRLTDAAHFAALVRIIQDGQVVAQTGAGQKAIVEYASVNVAKPIHVGHLRNTALGAALSRILASTGVEVIRWNYLGDWGTQFGKVVVAFQKWGSEERLQEDALAELLSLYVRFHEEARTDESLEDAARATFRKLENGDEEVRALWQRFRDASIEAAQPLFMTLGADFEIWDGEASLEHDLQGIIDELNEKGLLEKSEGASIVRLDEEGLPVAMIQKTDGASLYLTRDLALLKKRLALYSDARILYVVANEQSLNFQQLFAIGRRLGWEVDRALHVKYGLVLAEGGKKFSTREGRVVTATEVLNEAVARVIAKGKSGEEGVTSRSAVQVATSAVLYAMVKDTRTSDIRFDWDRLLDFTGDSGPYLQYTQARLASLIGKAELTASHSVGSLLDQRELELIRHLDRYTAAVQTAAEDLQTSHLALYLYRLASLVNGYYQSVPILKDDDIARRTERVALLETARGTLAAGMRLLGVAVVERV